MNCKIAQVRAFAIVQNVEIANAPLTNISNRDIIKLPKGNGESRKTKTKPM